MRRQLVRTLIAMTVLVTPAFAQSFVRQEERALFKRCADRISEDQIKACSDVIWEGPPNGDRLTAYTYRGVAYLALGQDRLAFSDFNTLIGLNPHDAGALIRRGMLFANLDDYSNALRDYNRALEIASNSAFALHGRGIVRLVQGDIAAAAKDFEAATEENTDEPMAQIWRFFANARLGHRNDSSLVRVALNLPDGAWPRPLLALYLGETDEKAIMALKISPFFDVARVQPCQSAFFSAEHQLIMGTTAEAKKLFATAVDKCPRDRLEYTAARGELARLQP